MINISFERIRLYLKIRDDEIQKDTDFDIYEAEALEKAISETPDNIGSKTYLDEIKMRTIKILREQGFKL